jgi:hypothetical protein
MRNEVVEVVDVGSVFEAVLNCRRYGNVGVGLVAG